MIDPNVENSLLENSGHAMIENRQPPGPGENDPEYYASIGGVVGRLFSKGSRRLPAKKVFQKRTDRIKQKKAGVDPGSVKRLHENLNKKYDDTPLPDEHYPPDVDGAAASQEALQESMDTGGPMSGRTQERINVDRHMEGAVADEANLASLMEDPVASLKKAETADDVARLMDVVGKDQGLKEPVRTHASIEAKTDTIEKSRALIEPFLSGQNKGLMNDSQILAGRRILSTLGKENVGLAHRITEIKSSGGKVPTDLLLEYAQSLEMVTAMHRYMKGQLREVARALSQGRMVSTTLEEMGVGTTEDAFKAVGGINHLTDHAMQTSRDIKLGLSAGVDPEKVMMDTLSKRSNRFFKTGIGTLVESWKSNILSSPVTHAVNISMNGAVSTYESVAVGLGAVGVRKVTNAAKYVGEKITGKKFEAPVDSATFAEWKAVQRTQLAGLYDGLLAFFETIKTGKSNFHDAPSGIGKTETQGYVPQIGESIGAKVGGETGGKVGHAIGVGLTFPFRALEAEDEFFKVWAFRRELTGLAVRDGMAKGLKGDDLNKHIDAVFNDPDKYGLFEPAMEQARMLTFTDQNMKGLLGGVQKSASQFVQEHPYLGFVVPFINTPTNLVRYSLEISGVGAPLSKRWRDMVAAGGAKRDIAISKMVLGLGITTFAYHLYDEGLLTGAGPNDPAVRKLWEQSGWQANSIKVGDTWVKLDRLNPVSTPLLAVAGYFDRAKTSADSADFQRYWMTAAFTFVDHTMNATFTQGIRDIFDLTSGKKDIEDYAAKLSTGFVPYSSLGRAARKSQTGPVRQSKDELEHGFGSSLEHALKEVNPFADEADWPRPARHWDGNVVMPREGEVGYEGNGELMAYGWSPIHIRKSKVDPVSSELAYNGVRIGEPASTFTMNGIMYSFFAMDDGKGKIYDEYFKVAGPLRRKTIEAYLSSKGHKDNFDTPGYRGRDGGLKPILEGLIRMADGTARSQFLMSENGKPSQLQELLDSGVYGNAMASKVATDFIEFNKAAVTDQYSDRELRDMKIGKSKGGVPLPRAIEKNQKKQLPHF